MSDGIIHRVKIEDGGRPTDLPPLTGPVAMFVQMALAQSLYGKHSISVQAF